jgi:HAD superfamily hydrolase (TIGR01509 family)
MAALVFDVMDTLLRDPYREAFEAATGLTFDAFASVHPEDAYLALERSEIDEPSYWATLRRAGIAVDVERFHAARREGYGWMPGMRALLHDAAAQHRVLLASNYPATWMADLRSGLLRDIRADVCGSCELGIRKPSRGFFDRIADRFSLDPGSTVLVDDSARNIEGAEAAGWLGVRHRDADRTRTSLAALGVRLVPG